MTTQLMRRVYLSLFSLLFVTGPILYGSVASYPDTIRSGLNIEQRMRLLHHFQDNSVYFFNADQAILEAIHSPVKIPHGSIRIIAVGDIMPGTNYPSVSYLPRSCSELFNPVRELLQSADLAIGNLEGVFCSSGGTPKQCRDTLNCYVFRMPDSYASCIRDAGIDILGVANNHVNDFGYEGRLNTIRRLDEEKIPFAGFPERPEVIVEVNGLKIGFIAFAPHTGTLNFSDYSEASGRVRELKRKADLVIVAFHSGAEGKDHQHVTRQDEVFLGHNRGNPWYFAHAVIDAGADLVVGHGPHVVRAVEFYKGKLIAYSLGNFCTWSRFNLSGPNANAPALEINLERDGSFISGKIHSFIQLGEGGPVPDPAMRAARKIKELTMIDFPEYGEVVDPYGNIVSPLK